MIGGTVVGIVDRVDYMKLIVRDNERIKEKCLVRVQSGHGFMLGDQVWWNGSGWVLWSRTGQFSDVKVSSRSPEPWRSPAMPEFEFESEEQCLGALENGVEFIEAMTPKDVAFVRETLAPESREAITALRKILERRAGLSPTARTEIERTREIVRAIQPTDFTHRETGVALQNYVLSPDTLQAVIAALDTVLGSASTKEGL